MAFFKIKNIHQIVQEIHLCSHKIQPEAAKGSIQYLLFSGLHSSVVDSWMTGLVSEMTPYGQF